MISPAVSSLIHRDALCFTAQNTLGDVFTTLASDPGRRIVVLDQEQRPLGVFTESELLLLKASASDAMQRCLDDLCHGGIATVTERDSVELALQKMSATASQMLCVVDDNGCYQGTLGYEDVSSPSIGLPSSIAGRRFPAIFNHQFQFTALLDPEYRVVEVNELPLKHQGASRDDYIGCLFWEVPAWRGLPEWQERIRSRLLTAKASDGAYITQDVYLDSEGNVRDAHASYRALREDDGLVWGYLVEALDITERNNSLQQLDYRLKLERVVSDVAVMLARSEVRNIEHVLTRSLEKLGDVVGAMRSHLFLLDADSETFSLTNEWCAEGVASKKPDLQALEVSEYQGVFDCIAAEQPLKVGQKDESAELLNLKEMLQQHGIASMISVPLIIDGDLSGFVGFDSAEASREWSSSEESLLRTTAEIFSSAIQRCRMVQKMAADNRHLEQLDKVTDLISSQQHADGLLQALTDLLLDVFDVDRAWLMAVPELGIDTNLQVSVESTVEAYPGTIEKGDRPIIDEEAERVVRDILEAEDLYEWQVDEVGEIADCMRRYQVASQLSLALVPRQGHAWLIGLHQCRAKRVWSADDKRLFAAIAKRIEQSLSSRILMQELQDKQASLLQAEDAAKLGRWELDASTLTAYWSDMLHELLGTTSNQPVGPAVLQQYVVPEDWDALEHSLMRAIKEGVLHEMEYRVKAPDESLCWVYCKGEPVIDETGKVLRLVGVIQDITERKQAEERLRLLANVVDNTAEGVIVTDAQANILEVNGAFCEIMGYSREEVLGHNPRMWKSGRHDAVFYSNLWASLQQTGRWHGEVWNRRKNGNVFPEWQTITQVKDHKGEVTHYVSVFSDISQVKQSQQQLDFLAHHDALTKLPNRLLLIERIEQAIRHSGRTGKQFALLFLDLDNFKHINESLGHTAGDDLLQRVAQCLASLLREGDTVARVGGDEFVMLLEEVGRAENAGMVAQKLVDALNEPHDVDGRHIFSGGSVGICLYPADGDDASTLLRNADAAMYRAKAEGRGTYRFYTEELTRNAFERVLLENSLRQAISEKHLTLYYQPQFELASGRLVGVEALLRWRHPQFGLVAPDRFIPLAEDAGLTNSIAELVMVAACEQAVQWLAMGLEIGRMAVNVAGPQIQRGDLVDEVNRVLDYTGLPADRLELEVTEGFIMTHADSAVTQLNQLRDQGIALAIDDFGTGYSSLSYLKRLPVHKLKIDRSFVRDLHQDPDDRAIANAVIALGNTLGMSTIAEGVEQETQAKLLREMGCDQVQGYLFGRPMAAKDMTHVLHQL